MKLSIMLRTGDFRGDHTADVCRAVEYMPGETIEHLAKRVQLGHTHSYRQEGDCLEIRLVEIEAGEDGHD